MNNKIVVFGDSHGMFNFKNIKYNNVINHASPSITMHRVGRDKLEYINFKSYNINDNDLVIYQFGEVDCRCHIGKQLLLNRTLYDIITELINNYIESIKINIKKYNKITIIVCSIPPTMCQNYYENIHGLITHEFPFVGTDKQRGKYTLLMNEQLKKECINNNFIFLDYYDYYKSSDNLLKIELSDNICHINDNNNILNMLYTIIDNIN